MCTVCSPPCLCTGATGKKAGSFFSSFASFQLLFRLWKAEQHSDLSGSEPLTFLQNVFEECTDSTRFTLLLHKAGRASYFKFLCRDSRNSIPEGGCSSWGSESGHLSSFSDYSQDLSQFHYNASQKSWHSLPLLFT